MSGVAISDPDQLAIATIRTLCIDAVQQADSGHPGTPMAMAPVAYTLWQRFLRFDPDDPIWPHRDRFVLSMGHASTLLYSMLHLTKVKAVNPAYETVGELSVKLEDLRRFRQLDSKCPGHPELILIASGSEVGLAVDAWNQLTAEGIRARVVSMPSWELFDGQPPVYRDEVLPPAVTARVAIEQASTFGWERYVGANGAVVGMDTFGASAPLKELQTKFGFTPEAVVAIAKARLAATASG